MRLLITSDLHYNHPKSKALADELIDRMNAAGGDVLLVVGDTAVDEGDAFERCLSRFTFAGPKLVVAGNHELWTRAADSEHLLKTIWPKRAAELGWQWIQDEPFVAGDIAVVGSVGWYDYSFAQPSLGIPRRFYEHKISPGAAERFEEFAFLFDRTDDIPPHAREIVARWNDGRHVKLGRSDEQFLAELNRQLESQLQTLQDKQVIAAIHHLPFRQILPPPHSAQWDFAKAYLGAESIGQTLLKFGNVSHVYCGHSHRADRAKIGHIQVTNIGSGYRVKTFETLDV
jgi:3',5'-cyclic AMP phosphodiesterase CpdA